MAVALALPKRSELDPNYTWNLESIYSTTDDWEADYKRVEKALRRQRGSRPRLSRDDGTSCRCSTARSACASEIAARK